jgi:hypothetical protein
MNCFRMWEEAVKKHQDGLKDGLENRWAVASPGGRGPQDDHLAF